MQILLIDDHELFRSGLSTALWELSDNTTIAEADSISTGRSIIEKSHQSLDLVLLDCTLPDGDGMDLLKHLRKDYPLLPVAMLSASEDPKLMRLSLELGAIGYIPKTTSTSTMLSAIRLMLSGGTYVPPKLLPALASTGDARVIQTTVNHGSLTQRQQEVLKLICQGLPNKEIAWRMHITEGTVKAHVSVILKARGCYSRKQLIASGD